MNEIKLETRKVIDIEGKFIVPSYQRGYRWGEDEVNRLLEDVVGVEDKETHATRNYCLQPVVVRKNGDVYELIDGQQRLTTIYLIYKYMTSEGNIDPIQFSLSYETRSESERFLEEMDLTKRDENIDFWFMANAYETIKRWFEAQPRKNYAMSNMDRYFTDNVKIIWYEVGESEDPIALFTRLNIGKIPLTSAELVKAMFLSADGNDEMTKERQEEISLQWDTMEKELHNESFWFFLTNSLGKEYPTRIDLMLDLISEKPEDCKEKYYTFFKFDEMRQDSDLKALWSKITRTFLTVKDWFEDHNLYHKIGYLIASKDKTLQELYNLSDNKKKSEFRAELEDLIRESVKINGNYGDLSYENSGDYAKITRLLILFNVESVRSNGERTQWFPFDKFKFNDENEVEWSLEHIHAQQSQGMKKLEEWHTWLEYHIPSMRSIAALNPDKKDEYEELIGVMESQLADSKLERVDFEDTQQKVIESLSVEGNTEYIHSIANLALLNGGDNAALNNSTFDVKRNKIIEMDKNDSYIPYCTKMVFLKYYTSSDRTQVHFWGQPDREAYIANINEKLKDYLEESITIE